MWQQSPQPANANEIQNVIQPGSSASTVASASENDGFPAHRRTTIAGSTSTMAHYIPVARTFRDECHLGYSDTNPIISIPKALKTCWQPAHWFLSATPCPSSPCNIKALMELTETRAWRQNPNTNHLNHEYLRELGKQFKQASTKGNLEGLNFVLGRLREFFQAINFLKRTASSVWFGRRCLKLPPQEIVDSSGPQRANRKHHGSRNITKEI
ncbi:hypothetical protein BJX96DRAFT_176051 [Aspergillus floccosus]